ncbi:Pls/PosA family non-ribosomal peptide synthetase [Streptomyces sp. NPDC088733]|uniref:Pls/PosA family non-ribosomal peptide synthetase n=1 Tax=Streptomyces sp. NPDC088733 TaxID=3365880 RepID=UPI003829477A
MVDESVELLAHDTGESSTTQRESPGPAAATEAVLADMLAGLLGVEQVPADSHFFEELGADSLVMAHFCARVRKHADLPSVSMREIYRHPTVRGLAAALTETAEPSSEAAPKAPAPVALPALPEPVGTPRHLLCGTLQVLFFLGYAYVVALIATTGAEWTAAGHGLADTYIRSVVFGGGGFLALCVLPVLGKWLIVGRWKPQQIRIWSLAYFRFWCVKTLIRMNPLILFVGSPLYSLYLRALGARIGRGVTVLSRHLPVCTDLLAIGDGSVIRKDSYLSCYRAHAGVIQTGPVTLGKGVFVGEVTVLDIGVSMGDGAQLAHASSLHRGQSVPDGERWHGSPAQPGAGADFMAVPAADCGGARKAAYSLSQLLMAITLYVPGFVGGVALLVDVVPQFGALLDPGPVALSSWTFYADALAASLVFFFGAALLGLLLVVTLPRLLNLLVEPDTVYPLYGFRYGVHRTIGLMTNRRFYRTLFGDSSAIVHYLRRLGYDLSEVEQTGSNFGTEVKHENPYLSSVGSGTMVADGLSIMNAEYSATSFRVTRVSIGAHNFLGNHIAYPAQGRTGENCLLATKVMVPLDGEVRENVGLLGSPSFEIPRTVLRDSRFDDLKSGEEFRARLTAKNRHNAVTMGLHLLMRWLFFFGVALIASIAADLYDLHPAYGVAVVALANVVTLAFTAGYLVLAERAATGFRGLRPLYCSIYDEAFWRHERYWKVTAASLFVMFFNGTPLKSVMWRLMGVRIGKRVYDDGCFLPERSLTTIGDDCTLNEGTVVQCHSQEDGTFKSDRITLGARCTLGVGALVHYGVTMHDGAELAPDSFLMKGEEMPPQARWGGNPAREMAEAVPVPQTAAREDVRGGVPACGSTLIGRE